MPSPTHRSIEEQCMGFKEIFFSEDNLCQLACAPERNRRVLRGLVTKPLIASK